MGDLPGFGAEGQHRLLPASERQQQTERARAHTMPLQSGPVDSHESRVGKGESQL